MSKATLLYCTMMSVIKHRRINLYVIRVLALLVFQATGFCPTDEGPNDKSLTKRDAEVPEITADAGNKAEGFATSHVYGMLGILMAMGITHKRRMRTHSGTSGHDSHPLVRSCMPRDLFLLFLGGVDVDVADQRANSHHCHDLSPLAYFWRRVFDQKFTQAVTNAFLLYKKWVAVMRVKCAEEIARLHTSGSAGGGAGGRASEEEAASGGRGGVEGDGGSAPLSAEELTAFDGFLARLRAMERVQWDQRLSEALMARCSVGLAGRAGGRRTRRRPATPAATWNGNAAIGPRLCRGSSCRPRVKKGKGAPADRTTTRTSGVCWCDVCTGGEGPARALHLCKICKQDPEAHAYAAATIGSPTARGNKRAEYTVTWRRNMYPS